MPSLVEIDPVVLEKKMKMWKVYDNDDEQIVIRWAKTLLVFSIFDKISWVLNPFDIEHFKYLFAGREGEGLKILYFAA